MATKPNDSNKCLSFFYKDKKINVTTEDQIRFSIEFANGEKKSLVFEIDTSMDLFWSFFPEGNQQQANEIGRLIEQQMMS